MTATAFSVSLSSGEVIHGEWDAPEGALYRPFPMVVFSHGFGVKRDSRGLFSAISEAVKDTHITVRFEYSILQGETLDELYPALNRQAESLQAVVKKAQSHWKPEKTIVIGHSLGGVVAAMNPELADQVILIASPLTSPYWRMRWRIFWKPNARYVKDGISQIGRKSGKNILIPADFWPQIKKIKPLHLYEVLSEQVPTTYIQAKNDEVLWDEPWRKLQALAGLSVVQLPSDHNFTGAGRVELCAEIKKVLTESND